MPMSLKAEATVMQMIREMEIVAQEGLSVRDDHHDLHEAANDAERLARREGNTPGVIQIYLERAARLRRLASELLPLKPTADPVEETAAKVQRVFFAAKAASNGPTREDALQEGWRAVARMVRCEEPAEEMSLYRYLATR
jgi:hypothetical protein